MGPDDSVLHLLVLVFSEVVIRFRHLVILSLLDQHHAPSSSSASKLASSAFSPSDSLSHVEPWSSSSSMLQVNFNGQFTQICQCLYLCLRTSHVCCPGSPSHLLSFLRHVLHNLIRSRIGPDGRVFSKYQKKREDRSIQLECQIKIADEADFAQQSQVFNSYIWFHSQPHQEP